MPRSVCNLMVAPHDTHEGHGGPIAYVPPGIAGFTVRHARCDHCLRFIPPEDTGRVAPACWWCGVCRQVEPLVGRCEGRFAATTDTQPARTLREPSARRRWQARWNPSIRGTIPMPL